MTFYVMPDSKEVQISLSGILPEGAKAVCANENDGAVEKHVPVAVASGSKVAVSVGSVAHPMLEAHYIKWIVLENKADVYVRLLNPGDKPEAVFEVKELCPEAKVYAFCNLHGLWASEVR